MNQKELKKILESKEIFKDINKWKLKLVPHGGVSPHTYFISKDIKKYFVKEIKENEKVILLALTKLKLGLIPKVVYSDLLQKGVLVQEYISGNHLKNKKSIEVQLIKKFAKFQNSFNDKNVKKKLNKFSKCESTDKDDGFFKGEISFNFNYDKDLLNLKKYKLQIVNDYISILDYLRKDKKRIIDEFSTMPFARQHHDFKEDNIVGKPQRLVDWGSSYGHGPFLFDLAPFLVDNKKAFTEFVKNSNICKKYNKEQIERWLYVSLSARFLELLRYRLEIGVNFRNKAECEMFLEYEYKTYKSLKEK
ncbi:MAG: hypothetical protein CMH63_02435 [Nanoarchaeota archaeon]|nr:hypothetical protein [Nanoarchaeota archaeon]|tara:strand:+ start:5807 stop:6721 length:915 start_codon:yes stop_codon:yes gene_type:complete